MSESDQDGKEGSGLVSPPPLSENRAPPVFGGGGQLGALNQQSNTNRENSANQPPSTVAASAAGAFGGSGSAFGSGSSGTTTASSSGNMFGSPSPAQGQQSAFGGGGGLFGSFGQHAQTGGAFGQPAQNGGAFGQTAQTGGAFGQPAQTGGTFGQTTQTGGAFGGGFGQTTQPAAGGGLFGQPAAQGGCGFGEQQPACGGGGGGLFGGNTAKGGKGQKREPRTIFYLVCGGEFVPERERQCRQQMNLIYNIIVEKGMASEKHILFVHGRGNKLNKTVRSFEATGLTFHMYGPVQLQQGFGFGGSTPALPKCPLPGPQDNAVVIFIGQGQYSKNIGGNAFAFNPPGQEASALDEWFGDLVFINSFSNSSVYKTTLKDLRAKNTLFISLADYSGESFQRAFDVNRAGMNKKLYVVCLSETFHPTKDHCLANAFTEFLDSEEWKSKTIEDLVDIIKDKYCNHPSVTETTAEVVKYNEEQYNDQVKDTGAWATGNFSDLLIKPIPPYDWAMFRKVEELKQSVEEANVGELSSHMKEKLDDFIESMEDLRTEAIKYNLHLPKPFEVMGDEDICTMTWKDFLMHEDA